MKRLGVFLLVLLMSFSAMADVYSQDEVLEMMDKAWKTAVDIAKQDPVRRQEVTAQSTSVPYYDMKTDSIKTKELDVCSITDGEYTMRYIAQVLGEPDENGLYPLYICLHGGGAGDEEGYLNNLEWLQMTLYYRDSVKNGIYVAVRGITENWNLHFDDVSYPLYDRLIEDMTLLMNADPDRVYLMGFSAGGDGVYYIAPRMADRFAAVNQSSGHPNGNNLMNTANLPVCIQAGIRDTMFSPMRSVAAAGFDRVLDEYRERFGFGYEHKVFIHVPNGHFVDDNLTDEDDLQRVLENPQLYAELMSDPEISSMYPQENAYGHGDEADAGVTELTESLGMNTVLRDTNAVRFVSGFLRNAHPENVVWDLSVRAPRETESFYWLKADSSVNTGIIRASFDKAENLFDIELVEEPNGDFSILLHHDMVDFSRPVYVRYGESTVRAEFAIDEDEMLASMLDTLDWDLAYAARIPFSSLDFGK